MMDGYSQSGWVFSINDNFGNMGQALKLSWTETSSSFIFRFTTGALTLATIGRADLNFTSITMGGVTNILWSDTTHYINGEEMEGTAAREIVYRSFLPLGGHRSHFACRRSEDYPVATLPSS
jgi:hypothetical protein